MFRRAADSVFDDPDRHSRAGTAFALGFLALGVCIAALFVTVAGRSLFQQREMLTSWPRVPGEVVAMSVRRVVGAGTGTSGGPGGAPSYRPIIEHTYSVGGTPYTSEQATPSGRDGTQAWAQSIIAPYAPGDTVEVTHDPADPAHSFVVRLWDDQMAYIALSASAFPVFMAFLLTAGGGREYALKWKLPAAGTLVYTLGVVATSVLYFSSVPPPDVTRRAGVVFAIALGLMFAAQLVTLRWRRRHLAWLADEGPDSP